MAGGTVDSERDKIDRETKREKFVMVFILVIYRKTNYNNVLNFSL